MFLRSALWMFTKVDNKSCRNFIFPKHVMPPNSTMNLNALTMLDKNRRRLNPFSGISTSFTSCNWEKIGSLVAGISSLASKYIANILHMHRCVQHSSKSDEPVTTGGLQRLNYTYGPFVIKNGKLTQYDPNMELVLPPKLPGIIIDPTYGLCGLGCYYGNGHVLTALHVLEDMYSFNTCVVFSKEDTLLMYRTEITQSCAMFPNLDLGFIKLIGDTSSLGTGFKNRMSEVKENDSVYFYGLNPSDQLHKKEGRVVNPYVSTLWNHAAFTMSVKGRPGDSGSPVYSNGRLVGIYLGVLFNRGHCSKIDPEVKLWGLREF